MEVQVRATMIERKRLWMRYLPAYQDWTDTSCVAAAIYDEKLELMRTGIGTGIG
jgi:hypothetical protein